MVTGLASDCPGCGTPRVAAAGDVCDVCQTPWATPQRRLVIVLFADLAGYTALCESRDPEEVHLLVRPLMNSLKRACEEVGAVVPSIEGDGFMAVLGARVTSERAPAQALQLGVQLHRLVAARREVFPDCPGLRVGIHAGEVLVAPSWEQTGFSVSGDAVNVASRLSSAAADGELLVSGALLELAGLGDHASGARLVALRGRDEAVAATTWDWTSAEVRPAAPRWGSVSHYVARPGLEQQLLAALDTGRGAVLVGDPGAGKSTAAAHLAGPAALRVSCLGPLDDVRALLVALLEQSRSGTAALRERLRHAPDSAPEDLLALCELAGAALPAGRPVVVDDAEALADEQLPALARAVAASSARWLVTSRRPRSLPLPVVEVRPLLPDEARELALQFLPGATPAVLDVLLRRAGDSPLFLEQCARLLVESGTVSVDRSGTHLVDAGALRAVPRSMRLFVSGRLDLLVPAARELIGLASVLGDEPDHELLMHLAGRDTDALDDLLDRGFLAWTEAPHRRQLRFSHALVRDVAYETLPRSRRAEVHRLAAEWYAVLPVSAVLEQQAFHLESALALAPGDCDDARRTVEAMVLYARSIEEERAASSRDVLRRAMAIVDSRPECGFDRLPLLLSLASVQQVLGSDTEAEQAAESAYRLAVEVGDTRAQAESSLVLARVLVRQDGRDPTGALERATDLFTAVDDPAGLARVAIERGLAAQHRHGVRQHLEHMEQAYVMSMRSGDTRLQATSAQQLALHHAIVNGRDEFELWADRARQASRADDLRLTGRLRLAEATLAMFGLEPGIGLEPARDAHMLGRELGHSEILHNALVARLELLVMDGRLADAEGLLEECHAVSSRRPSTWLRRMLDLSEARLRSRQGRPEQARALLQAVAEDPLSASHVLTRDLAEARAWVALESGRFAEAREHAKAAVLIDEESQERVPALRARFLYLVGACGLRENTTLTEVATLRADARASGLSTVTELASRWTLVEDLSHGWSVDLHGLDSVDVIEARALDHEIAALTSRDWDRLLRAAETWSELGHTIWRARALLWHSELTGVEHPETDEVLRALAAPAGVAEQLRSQVRGLRG